MDGWILCNSLMIYVQNALEYISVLGHLIKDFCSIF